jgi:hypothetical protein
MEITAVNTGGVSMKYLFTWASRPLSTVKPFLKAAFYTFGLGNNSTK